MVGNFGLFGTTWEFDLEYIGTGTNTSFDVYLNGDFYTFLESPTFPILMDIPCLPNNVAIIKFCVNDQPNCCIEIELELPPCTDPCSINDLIVEAYDCTPNGVFYVDLDFIPVNPVAGSFNLYVDGDFYGNYPYSDLPLLEIGPFEANGQVYVFTVKDEVNPDCAASFELESENCINPPCGLDNLTAELVGNFGLFGTTWEFDLEYIGTGTNTSFDVYLNGDFYTFLESPTFPILMDIPCLPNNVAIIKFCVNDQPNCCIEIELELPPCTDPCSINDLIVEAYDCTPNGVFYVDLDFIPLNPAAFTFDLYIGNSLYGTYEYNQLPLLEIGPFEANGQVYVFTVKDAENPDCAASFELESEDCIGGTCGFENIIVEAYDCNAAGEFYVDIDFDVINPAGDEFELYVNNELHGIYSYSDLPLLEIGPFVGDGSIYVFTFKDHTDPSCWASYGIESPDCNGDCAIYDLTAQLLEVGPNGTSWEIKLEYSGVPDPASFDIYLNGEFYTYVVTPDIPFVLEIPCQNSSTAELKVCVNDQPGCCETIALNVPPVYNGMYDGQYGCRSIRLYA